MADLQWQITSLTVFDYRRAMSFFTAPSDMGLLHLGCKLSGQALCRAGNTGPESVVCGALRRNPVEFARDFFIGLGCR